jgi:hypothetical protein
MRMMSAFLDKRLRLIILDPRLTKLSVVYPVEAGDKVLRSEPVENVDVIDSDIVVVLQPGLHWSGTVSVGSDGHPVSQTRSGGV